VTFARHHEGDSHDSFGRRQALSGLLVGAATLVSGSASPAVAKKKGKHKSKGKTCPEPTVCPALPSTCPVRKVCCVCNATSPTPGCKFSASLPARPDGLPALCDELCGGTETANTGTRADQGGTTETLFCSPAGTACLTVACPIY
jgi:hypothetical protein